MVTLRQGHSLPELIVAVTVLGIGLGGVAASSLIGARWVAEAIGRQEAVRAAAELLDSLAVTAEPGSGAVDRGHLRLEWTVEGEDGAVRVTARTSTAGPGVELEGRTVPPVPILPDVPESVAPAVSPP